MLLTLLAMALAAPPAVRGVPSTDPLVQALQAALPTLDACVVGQTGALSFAIGTDKAGKVTVVRSVAKDVRDAVATPPGSLPTTVTALNALFNPQGPVLPPLTSARSCFEATVTKLQFAAGEPRGINVDFARRAGDDPAGEHWHGAWHDPLRRPANPRNLCAPRGVRDVSGARGGAHLGVANRHREAPGGAGRDARPR